MLINFLFLLGLIFIFYFLFKNIKTNKILWLTKCLLQIGILILFIGGFFKIIFNLPPNLYIKLIFLITYTWCTIGINVNLMIPLIGLIDQKIEKN